tara:strand:- start:13093 stop:14034 length:942 start_codon:yes stop_codon:yes gene_type:complete
MSGVVTGAISLGIGAVSTGFSFVQAKQARDRSEEAQLEANRKMADARGRTGANFYENLAVQQETYNRAYREQQVAARANLQAMQEQGVRGVAGVGMLQQATQDAMSSVRSAQEKELMDRDRLIAQEDSRLRDINIQLDLGEVEGAQLAAASESNAANYAIQQGIQGLTDIGVGIAESQSLFGGGTKRGKDGMSEDAKGQLGALTNNAKNKAIGSIDATGNRTIQTATPSGLTSSNNTQNAINKPVATNTINTNAKTKTGKGIGEVFTRPGDPYEFKKLPDGKYVTRKKGQGSFKPISGGLDLIDAAFKEQFGE